jgi:tripeptidyl-peptidase-1
MRSLILSLVVCATLTMGATLPATVPPRPWKRAAPKAGELNLGAIQKMTIGLKRKNLDVLDKIFWDVSNPDSVHHGDHLKHEQMRELISTGASGIAKVTAWLKEHGINEYTVARHEDAVAFDAPAAKIEELLKVKFEVYENAETNQRAMRATSRITIPDALAPVVELISGHRGFPFVLTKHKIGGKLTNLQPLQSTLQNVTPALLREIYNINEVTKTPAGSKNIQSFAQFQGQYVDPNDLKTFCDALAPGLEGGDCKISKYVNGVNNGNSPGVESSLDSEYITAMGQGAETWAWTYDGTDFCGDLVRWGMDVLQTKEFPNVISVSYGLQGLPNYCLGPDVMRFKDDMMKMGAMGISVTISSGDSGSAEYSRLGYNYGLLSPSFLSSVPYCTAVGATEFVAGNSGQEKAAGFGSGGGFSFDYAQPEYQQSAVQHFLKTNTKLPPKLSYNATGRATPDVSFSGVNFVVISGGQWQSVGGTSCSSPSFAGLVSQLNNIRMENGKTLGFLNPWLYKNPGFFTDIVEGSNDVHNDGMGWYCSEGWDPATGLGTPNFGKLAAGVRAINAKERAAHPVGLNQNLKASKKL